MTDGRLPSRLIVSSLIRRVEQAGGMAAVLLKGDEGGGGILLVIAERGGIVRLIERGHDLDGHEVWRDTADQVVDKTTRLDDYLGRRRASDPDLWAIELDIPDSERFVADMLGAH